MPTSLEEWGQFNGDAYGALTWTRACTRQIQRWRLRWRQAFQEDGPSESPNFAALEEAHVEGYYLVLAANRLRATLAAGCHADLLAHLRSPQHLKNNVDGATYVEHVRNAQEHDDERGYFVRDYGFGHTWSNASGDGSGAANVGGIELLPFVDALAAIEIELERRSEEATRRINVALAEGVRKWPKGEAASGGSAEPEGRRRCS